MVPLLLVDLTPEGAVDCGCGRDTRRTLLLSAERSKRNCTAIHGQSEDVGQLARQVIPSTDNQGVRLSQKQPGTHTCATALRVSLSRARSLPLCTTHDARAFARPPACPCGLSRPSIFLTLSHSRPRCLACAFLTPRSRTVAHMTGPLLGLLHFFARQVDPQSFHTWPTGHEPEGRGGMVQIEPPCWRGTPTMPGSASIADAWSRSRAALAQPATTDAIASTTQRILPCPSTRLPCRSCSSPALP